MTTLSAHVLDAALGLPAAGLAVHLVGVTQANTVTDDDGRVRFPDPLPAGSYALVLATGAWFAAADRDTFWPEVRLDFTVDAALPHHHVALLLSPYSYTAYRGS